MTNNWIESPGASWVLWVLLIAFESGAQLSLKVGGDGLAAIPFGLNWLLAALSSVAVMVAVFCYIGSFLTWMLILRSSKLSLAFPLSSLVFVVVLLGSWLGLGESISALHWLGVCVIIGGIVLLAEGKQEV
ncbi:MAG: transporter [Pseudomonas sp.]|jgi:drug/metabolite transporter (DMT)-like permease|uniref:EamA family transporter n=1 Tax=Pseudomonas sp. TaxID=306 RepID=UPI00262C282E|nr:EamA family transporter [Pseudomonas sp.]MDB6051648.1 transporter [Pseudomonas sp.]